MPLTYLEKCVPQVQAKCGVNFDPLVLQINKCERCEVLICEYAKSSWYWVCSFDIYILVDYSRQAVYKYDSIPNKMTWLVFYLIGWQVCKLIELCNKQYTSKTKVFSVTIMISWLDKGV
jgi:hypothetical protein